VRYGQVKDGEWIRPRMRGWRMKCCGCGLVHRFNFRLAWTGSEWVVEFQAFRCKAKTRC